MIRTNVMFCSLLLLLLLVVVPLPVKPQVTTRGIHTPLHHLPLNITHRLPYVSNFALLATEELPTSKDAAYQFAKAFPVDIAIQEQGQRVFVGPRGDWVWRVKIQSPGALSLSLVWGEWWIPEGAEVWVYNQKTTLGAFTSRTSNKPSRTFATAPLLGDTLTIEYYSPSWVKALPTLRITRVAHGYKPFLMPPQIQSGPSGSCNIDVACESNGWQDQMRSVGVLLTQDNQKYCSGALLNNVKGDGRQLFLTANHCTGFYDVSNHLVMFNYQRTQCGIPEEEPAMKHNTVHGVAEISSFRTSDYTVYEIIEPIPDDYDVYMSGWSALTTAKAPIVGIHHPMGDVKKISYYDGNLSQACWSECPETMHWKIDRWTRGTTEPGSSGSPLFNSDRRIVGQLHGGSASCYNDQGYDLYGALWASFEKGGLKAVLDPEGTGRVECDGMDLSAARKKTQRFRQQWHKRANV